MRRESSRQLFKVSVLERLSKGKMMRTESAPKKIGGHSVSTASGESVSPKVPSSPKAAGKSIDPPSPKASKRIEKTSSGIQSAKVQSLISRLTSRGSMRSRRMKSESETTIHVVQSQKHLLLDFETELRNAFNVFDSNGDGKITVTELGSVLRSIGNDISESDLQLIMSDVGNRDGYISFTEFNKAMTTSPNSKNSDGGEYSPRDDEAMKVAFQIFDKDGDQRISAHELQVVLRSLGDKGSTLDDCRRMISNVDRNGDGFVDYKEFQVLMGAAF